MLSISSYNEREIYHNVKGEINRHNQMKEEVTNGERDSMYQDTNNIMKSKDIKGGLSAASWFLDGDVRAVILCQATPGSRLTDMIQKKIGQATDCSRYLDG